MHVYTMFTALNGSKYEKTKAGAHDAMTRIDVAGAEPAPKYLRSASKNTEVAAFGQIWGFWFQHVS